MKCRNCGVNMPRGAWETICPRCGRRYPPLWRVSVGLVILVFVAIVTVPLAFAEERLTIGVIMSTISFIAFVAFYAAYVAWLYWKRKGSTNTLEKVISSKKN